ncbi:MAG TPA: SRPBCC domain-containing protein [Ktedonobacterales bacterium]|nr:SRPBCC domain-containing protein [Ktedonobacterales bacterium]
MRIEGTYTFPGAIARVFALLVNPDALAQAIPGCERFIQLGPAAADDTMTFEMRLLLGERALPYTMTIRAHAVRRPAYLRLDVQGRGPGGPLSAQGALDLVEQEDYTVAAYTLNVEATDLPGDLGFAQHAAQLIIRDACSQIAAMLPDQWEDASLTSAHTAAFELAPHIETARGHIVALPAKAPSSELLGDSPWAQRALWMGAGLGLGLSAIGVTLGIVRWLGGQGDE